MAEKVTVELRDKANLSQVGPAIIALAQQKLNEPQESEENLLKEAS